MKLEEIPTRIAWTMNTLSRMNDNRTVVLHLDRSMVHPTGFLPTLNLRGDNGFYPFPAAVRDEVAAYFGSDITIAQARVTEINAARGVSTEDAREILLGIFRGSGAL